MSGDEKDLASRLLDAGVEHLLRSSRATGSPKSSLVTSMSSSQSLTG